MSFILEIIYLFIWQCLRPSSHVTGVYRESFRKSIWLYVGSSEEHRAARDTRNYVSLADLGLSGDDGNTFAYILVITNVARKCKKVLSAYLYLQIAPFGAQGMNSYVNLYKYYK